MRNPKDAGRVREALQEAGLADEINPAIVAAPICRPELRSETAALPVLPLADRFYVETQAISGAAGTNRASVRSSAKLTLASLRLRATRAAVLLIPRSRNRR